MIKVVKAKYLSTCESCGNQCTYLIRANKKYLHLCTSCLLNTFIQCENILGEEYKEAVKHESQKQVEQ